MNNVQPSFAGHFSVLSLPAVSAPSVLSPMALIPTSTDIALRSMEPSGSTTATTFAQSQLTVMNGAAAPLTMGELLKVCRRLDWPGEVGLFSSEKAARLVRHIGADTPVTDITTEYIDQLIGELREKGLRNQQRQVRCIRQSNSTISKYLSALSVMLKRALRRRAIVALPIFPESRTLRQPERRVFTPKWEWVNAQVKHLKQHPDVADLIRFLADTGCRPDEAFRLTWDRIDLDASVPHVTFVKTKGRQARIVPLARDSYSCFDGKSAIDVLRSRWAVHTHVALNLDEDSRSRGPFGHIGQSAGSARYKAFRRHFSHAKNLVCDELGLDTETREYWKIYSLRKARATNLLVAGKSTYAVKYQLGHKSISTTCAYYADIEALRDTILEE